MSFYSIAYAAQDSFFSLPVDVGNREGCSFCTDLEVFVRLLSNGFSGIERNGESESFQLGLSSHHDVAGEQLQTTKKKYAESIIAQTSGNQSQLPSFQDPWYHLPGQGLLVSSKDT